MADTTEGSRGGARTSARRAVTAGLHWPRSGVTWQVTPRTALTVRPVPTLVPMTKLTVEVDDHVASRVAAAAAERGVAPEALAAEVLSEQFGIRRKLGFVSIGRSTSGRQASEDEDLLAEGFGR